MVEGCGVPEKRPLSRRLRARRLPGSPEDGRFCVACGRDTPGGRLKTTVYVLLRVGAALGDLRKRPVSRCYARARPGLLRKRPKVCALIQQGAADPCFVALAICITPGRWRARFRGAATPKLKRILLAFSDAGGLNARPQSFAVRNKRKTLRFTAGTSPSVPGKPPRPCESRLYLLAGSACASSSTNCATRRLGLSAA